MRKAYARPVVAVALAALVWLSCGRQQPVAPAEEGPSGARLGKPVVQQDRGRTTAVVTVRRGRAPAAGLEVAFSRSISGRRADYQWKGTTDADGRATVEITGDRVSGYYRARAVDPASGGVVGEWWSIPINGGRENVFSLPVGRQALATTPFPNLIPLPANFGPEGIAVGNGTDFYVGSLAAATAGQILVGDLRTGEVFELVARTGRPALGMKYDSRTNLLFVANGGSGRGTVYNATSGAEVAFYQFKSASTTINDVVLTRDAAYFTDSTGPFLYRVALGPQPATGFTQISLPANFGAAGPYNPNARGNGIVGTPDGRFLIIVHTGEGKLYRMDTATSEVAPIALSGGDVGHGDGLLLEGQRLYVVQNRLDKVAVVEMSPDYLSGTITRYITEPFASNPATKVPTTIAAFGNFLYAVTAGFASPAPDFVVRMPK
jgi:sugar lactone lactonase YvrE